MNQQRRSQNDFSQIKHRKAQLGEDDSFESENTPRSFNFIVFILIGVAFIGFILCFSSSDQFNVYSDFTTIAFYTEETPQYSTPTSPSSSVPNPRPSAQSPSSSSPNNTISNETLPSSSSTNQSTNSSNVSQTFTQKIEFQNPLPLDQIIIPIIPNETYIPLLSIEWTLYGPDHLNIIIRDANNSRSEIPLEDPYPHPRHPPLSELANSNFEANITTDPFNIVIRRKSTNEVIFELIDRFVYTDFYMEFSFKTPTNRLYGLGERSSPLQIPPGTYTLFIIDRPGLIDPGVPGYNSNGHQSVYLMGEQSNLYHICLLRNIHAQEIVVEDKNILRWKIVGGVIDLNFFLGETPESAVEKYHEYVGGWTLPALWHLGSHQCKWWGYKTVGDLHYVLSEYNRVNLPLDALWSDIDYLRASANFWFDDGRFPPNQMTQLFENYKKRWIPVIQSYIPSQRESHAWTFPNVSDIMIKDGLDPNAGLMGKMYNGFLYFVDNFHPSSEEFWNTMYDYLDNLVPISGVWLDANEVTNGMHTIIYNRTHAEIDRTRKYYNLPFYPGGKNFYDLAIIDPDALHYGNVDEWNVRPLNSLLQSRHSYNYLKKKFAFPFVLTRGNVMGSGQYSYHFIPDIHSYWEYLRVATAQISTYNIFGIPMIGPDVCGMVGEGQTNPEICARWYQIGAFYPFARNHHQPQNVYNFQEPYRYSGIYFDAIAAGIHLRYSILKQFYAIFFNKKGTTRKLGTIFRPVFFEFSTDPTLPAFGHYVHEDQFMLGEMLMVAPAVRSGVVTLEAYFPDCRWYDLRDQKEVPVRGQITSVNANITQLPPHYLRGGYMFFKQDTTNIRSTDDLSNTFTAFVGLNDLQESASTKVSQSEGYIMGASNNDEKYIYDNCALKSCMLKTKVDYEYRIDDKITMITLRVDSVVPHSTSDSVEIDEIYVMGIAPETLQTAKQVSCSDCQDEEPIELAVDDGWVKISSLKLVIGDGKVYTFMLME